MNKFFYDLFYHDMVENVKVESRALHISSAEELDVDEMKAYIKNQFGHDDSEIELPHFLRVTKEAFDKLMKEDPDNVIDL